MSGQIDVLHGSRLGWTYEDSFNPVSFDFILGYPLIFRRVFPATNFPDVGQTYVFDNLTFPAKHSIQVGVITGKYNIIDVQSDNSVQHLKAITFLFGSILTSIITHDL